jgi:hypothetical protein
MAMHLADPFFDDAFDRPAPTGVEYADCTALRVDQHDREAISGLNADCQIWHCGDETIAGKFGLGRRIDEVDDIGMNLSQRY